MHSSYNTTDQSNACYSQPNNKYSTTINIGMGKMVDNAILNKQANNIVRIFTSNAKVKSINYKKIRMQTTRGYHSNQELSSNQANETLIIQREEHCAIYDKWILCGVIGTENESITAIIMEKNTGETYACKKGDSFDGGLVATISNDEVKIIK